MGRERMEKIVVALARIRAEVDNLKALGREVPAVEKNAVRMSGTLRTLEIQFTDLLASGADSGG